MHQWSRLTPFGVWRRKGVQYERDEVLAPGLCPVLMETLLVIRSTSSCPASLQPSSLASSIVAGKSATRGLESHPDYHTYSKASVSAVVRAPEEEIKPHNSCTDTEEKAEPPCQAAQAPAAGMGPCGMALFKAGRGLKEEPGLQQTPGSVFLLSIFLKPTHILFFSAGRTTQWYSPEVCGPFGFQTS